MSKKVTAFACECSCGQRVNSKKDSIEAHEKPCFSNPDSHFSDSNWRLIMYRYLLNRLPSDWFEKHDEEIESLGYDFYNVDLIAEAFRSDVEIERPFEMGDLNRAIAIKRGLSPTSWDGDMFEEAKEKAAIEILSREYGDIIGPLSEPRTDHLEKIL